MEPLVKDVYYESEKEAFDRFKKDYKNSPLASNISVGDIPPSYRVQLSDPEQFGTVASAFEGAPGVASVPNLRQVFAPLFRAINIITGVMIGLAVLTLVSAVLLMATTIRRAAFTRRREIAIMKLVGASNRTIRTPFIIETVASGLIGAVMAVGLLWVTAWALFDKYLLAQQGSGTAFISSADVWVIAPFPGRWCGRPRDRDVDRDALALPARLTGARRARRGPVVRAVWWLPLSSMQRPTPPQARRRTRALTGAALSLCLLAGVGHAFAATPDPQTQKGRVDQDLKDARGDLRETSKELVAAYDKLAATRKKLPGARSAAAAAERAETTAKGEYDDDAVAAYDLAKANEDKAEKQLKTTSSKITTSRRAVAGFAGQLYQQQGMGTPAVAVGSETPAAFIDRMIMAQSAGDTQTSALEELSTSRANPGLHRGSARGPAREDQHGQGHQADQARRGHRGQHQGRHQEGRPGVARERPEEPVGQAEPGEAEGQEAGRQPAGPVRQADQDPPGARPQGTRA
uniref:Permease-like cell division protein FtsX n=1 Tax=Janibacter limosus TaxID=53458 RepID=A0AC61U1P2_9MICO|nr:permease-like cell division protein FtsX [Janibacter limosus]